MSRRSSRRPRLPRAIKPSADGRIRAEDIIAAIRRKHPRGALATELVLDDKALLNRDAIERAKLYGWPVQSVLDRIGDKPVATEDELLDAKGVFSRRIDGLLYANQKLIAIEVKVSRADFKRETEAKRRPWEAVSSQFVYATPKGLLDKSEIPSHCGLWEVDDTGLVIATKSAKVNKNPEPLPQQVIVAMMYRAQRAELDRRYG